MGGNFCCCCCLWDRRRVAVWVFGFAVGVRVVVQGGGATGLRCRSFGRVGVKDVFCFRERGRGRLQYEWFR